VPRIRLHPCALPALWSVLALASAVAVGLEAPLLGAALALFALVWVLAFGYAIAQGHPQLDAPGADRLAAILDDLGVEEPIAVLVCDRQPIALRGIRGRRPRLIADTEFVRAAGDDLLRAAVALGVAELHSEQLARQSRRRLLLAVTPLGLAAGFASGLLAPLDVSPPLVVLAATAPGVWLALAGAAALTREPAFGRAYAFVDDAAIRLSGDPAAVRRALDALAQWRGDFCASRGRFASVLARCLQPLAADWHEAERAARLAP
jgi:hypothetical protein